MNTFAVVQWFGQLYCLPNSDLEPIKADLELRYKNPFCADDREQAYERLWTFFLERKACQPGEDWEVTVTKFYLSPR